MSSLFKSYVFRGKEPAIDEFRTLVEDHFGRRITKKDMKLIENDGGPRSATMVEWFWGKTLRPQSATMEAAGRALGYRRTWVKMKVK